MKKWIENFFWKPFILGVAHFTTKELKNASTVLYMKMMEVVDRRKKEKPKKSRKN
ncbi:hypothetical protein LEP1GSC088_2827 [Leptospira interrogans str. L1207]|nr:hypothetical protein LEP1GSC088_2827 [Leptospira interrogans str. L1207]